VRLVIARCSVDYSGRLTAHLPEATRLIMVKADGTLAIHSDGNASKPLNWMVAPNVLEIHDDRWLVTNGKGEQLTIWISARSICFVSTPPGRPLRLRSRDAEISTVSSNSPATSNDWTTILVLHRYAAYLQRRSSLLRHG